MTDKRSESERVSGRPSMPSIAPPTDDIDSEWGADAIPGSVPLPTQVAAASPSASTPALAPRPSTPAPPAASRPSAVSTPLVAASTRPSAVTTPLVPAVTPPSALATPVINAPMPAAALPLVAANNPLRKQTLFGMAPVLSPRSEPPAAAAAPPAATALGAGNPRRKQTLLGIAPVIPDPKPAPAPAAEPASSVASIVTPAMVATDAPTTADVPEPPVVATKPRRSEPARPAAAVLSIRDDDLPELKPRRPRWQVPLGVAAALALGVVGLRQLDHAPTPTPPELAHPVNAAKPGANAAAKALKAKADDTQARPAAIEGGKAAEIAAAAASDPQDSALPTPSAGLVRIKVDSDPEGARMFRKGKEVGTTPFVLELQPGEKHAYELGLPGYTTRKVVIDGSKTDISIGLRPDPAASIGLSQRK